MSFFFNCYNKKYIFTLNELFKSEIFRSIYENGFDDFDDTKQYYINIKELCSQFFVDENEHYWDWIYNDMKMNRNIFPYIYNYDKLLNIIPFVNYLSIKYIITNIAFTINNNIFTLYDIMENYNYIFNCDYLNLVVQLLLIKKLLSINNIINYLNLIGFTEKNDKYIVDDFLKKINNNISLLSSNNLIVNIKIQNKIFNGCIDNFLLLSNMENITKVFIPDIFYKLENIFSKFNIKTFKDIIDENYFDEDEEGWEHSIYGFKVIVIDFKSSLDFLSFFNQESIIYEFLDKYTNKKYLIFSNSFFCGNEYKYLSFEDDFNYPFPSKNNIKSKGLTPLFKIKDLVNKNYFYKNDSNIVITYENNFLNEYIYENIFHIIKS